MESPEFNDVMCTSPINTSGFKTNLKTKHGHSYPTSRILEFQIFRQNILHFMKRATMFCSNRSSGVYPLNQGHMTKQPLAVNKWFYTPPPLPPPPHTHSTPLLLSQKIYLINNKNDKFSINITIQKIQYRVIKKLQLTFSLETRPVSLEYGFFKTQTFLNLAFNEHILHNKRLQFATILVK